LTATKNRQMSATSRGNGRHPGRGSPAGPACGL